MSLLSFEEACERIHQAISTAGTRPVEEVALEDAAGRALASPIIANEHYPRFDNSGVDGYALFHPEDAVPGKTLSVVGTMSAGDAPYDKPPAGCAIRILTGAQLPRAAYAVVMQEDIVANNDTITLREGIDEGRHIRKAGDDYRKGDMILQAATTVGPGELAVLASQGIMTVRVKRGVSCAIIATGAELVAPEENPGAGQLRDSNSIMLRALAEDAGCAGASARRVTDDEAQLRKTLLEASASADVIIVSGGVSVGDKDYLPAVVADIGSVLFHRVAVRPGKPLLFGIVGDALVFGLPGNPASTFVCFHLFVRDAIRMLGGHAQSSLRWAPVALESGHREIDRDDFVRAKAALRNDQLVAIQVREQGSFGLLSLADANCLVRVPANTPHSPGDMRMALML